MPRRSRHSCRGPWDDMKLLCNPGLWDPMDPLGRPAGHTPHPWGWRRVGQAAPLILGNLPFFFSWASAGSSLLWTGLCWVTGAWKLCSKCRSFPSTLSWTCSRGDSQSTHNKEHQSARLLASPRSAPLAEASSPGRGSTPCPQQEDAGS